MVDNRFDVGDEKTIKIKWDLIKNKIKRKIKLCRQQNLKQSQLKQVDLKLQKKLGEPANVDMENQELNLDLDSNPHFN